jgi:hypothetical protein
MTKGPLPRMFNNSNLQGCIIDFSSEMLNCNTVWVELSPANSS